MFQKVCYNLLGLYLSLISFLVCIILSGALQSISNRGRIAI